MLSPATDEAISQHEQRSTGEDADDAAEAELERLADAFIAEIAGRAFLDDDDSERAPTTPEDASGESVSWPAMRVSPPTEMPAVCA